MAHPLRTSVDDLIAGLKGFEHQAITSGLIAGFLRDVQPSAKALAPYTFFRDSYYTRNLIYKDALFEVMVICWLPGQKTPVHSHNGQLGWMTVAQGEMLIHNYKYVGCDTPEHQNVVGMDCLAGGSHIELDRLSTVECDKSAPVCTVDKLHTIHRIDTTGKSKAGCISLHIYSLPIESCVSYDLEKRKCVRKSLSYYSRYGAAELEGSQLPDGKLRILS